MEFHTLEFFVFFVLVGGFALAYQGQTRKWLLLLASYNFYMAWDPRFAGLILASTLIDYLCGLRIEAVQSDRARRAWLIASIVSNLGILAFFKYLGFFTHLVNDFLLAFDIQQQVQAWKVVLPVGISFFTFQSMSHTIDVYRRQIPAERSFLDFAVYVAFFPQLVAGPIVRAKTFLPQLKTDRPFLTNDFVDGLERVLVGLVKKVVIADNLSVLVDLVFSSPGEFDTPMVWLGAVCFGLQIYLDFSGYSDMAIGLAQIMGFSIPENFRMPYLSTSPAEFWQRWHISLSTWLRDYLYIPLGGNRLGKSRTLANLTMTMLLGGLWHGANYRFLLWGLGHGLLLVVYRILSPLSRRLGAFPGRRLLAGILFFVLVTILWVPFRAKTSFDMVTMFEKMFVAWELSLDPPMVMNVSLPFIGLLLGSVAAVHALALLAGDWISRVRRVIWVRAVVWGFLAFVLFQFRHDGQVPFLYFQF